MIGRRSFSPACLATVLGLIIGAAGIAILWAVGVVFPIYPPPGIILLVVGAIFVGLAPWRWVPLVGTLLGAFITVGFLISPTGLSSLSGGAARDRRAPVPARWRGAVTICRVQRFPDEVPALAPRRFVSPAWRGHDPTPWYTLPILRIVRA